MKDKYRVWVCAWVCARAQSLQLRLTLCNPMNCSPPGYSLRGSLQARTLEWVAMHSSRGSSRPRDRTCVSISCVAGKFLTAEPPGKPRKKNLNSTKIGIFKYHFGLPWWLSSKESTCNAGSVRSIPGLGRAPGEGNGNLPLQFCLEIPHGQRSLQGLSPWGHKESDMTKWLSIAHSTSWLKTLFK